MDNSLASAAILVLTHLPDRACATALARELVEAGLAACVNVGAPVDSLYHWHGQLETAIEVPLIIKTGRERYGDVERAIRAAHPYELPEIVAVPIVDGLEPYLAWITAETSPK